MKKFTLLTKNCGDANPPLDFNDQEIAASGGGQKAAEVPIGEGEAIYVIKEDSDVESVDTRESYSALEY